jgi:nucleotide-binding universal stress UspA family protein
MIPEIKKILYATDLSKNSAYAFYYALGMAEKNNATIVLLHVVEPLPKFGIGFKDFREMVEHERKEEATQEIEKRRKAITEFVTPDINKLVSNIVIRMGYPMKEILKVADEERCDVIILGSHGEGVLTQSLLGSVSNAVLHRARKPVFIIPLPSEKTTFALDSV